MKILVSRAKELFILENTVFKTKIIRTKYSGVSTVENLFLRFELSHSPSFSLLSKIVRIKIICRQTSNFLLRDEAVKRIFFFEIAETFFYHCIYTTQFDWLKEEK